MFARKSSAEQLRDRQIEGLREAVPNCRQLNADRSQWEVPVPTKFGVLKFSIYLPPRFPEVGPDLRLLVQAAHPWVTPDLRIIGHPLLEYNWSPHHSLGKICSDVVTEFTNHPPTPVQLDPRNAPPPAPLAAVRSPPPVAPAPAPVSAALPAALSPPPQPQVVVPPPARSAAPELKSPIPSTFPELDGYSTNQLKDLVENNDMLEDFVESLDVTKEMVEVRNKMLIKATTLANENLARRGEIQALKTEVDALKATYSEKLAKVKELQEKEARVLEKFTVKSLSESLRASIAEAQAQSDATVAQLLEKGVEPTAFVRDFVAQRTLLHVRQAKLERLASRR